MEGIVLLIGTTLPTGLDWLAGMIWGIRSRHSSDPAGDTRRVLKTEFGDRPK